MIKELGDILRQVRDRVSEIHFSHWNTLKEIPAGQYPALLLDRTELQIERLGQGSLYNTILSVEGYLLDAYPKNDAHFNEAAFEELLDKTLKGFLSLEGYHSKVIKTLKVTVLEIAGKKEAAAYFHLELERKQQW